MSDPSQPKPIKLNEHNLYDWRKVLCDLYSLQQSGIFCDVTLVTLDDAFNGSWEMMDKCSRVNHITAHKVVLANRVPYFQAMFSSSILLKNGETRTQKMFIKWGWNVTLSYNWALKL